VALREGGEVAREQEKERWFRLAAMRLLNEKIFILSFSSENTQIFDLF
jgi:hypothetical protein